MHSAVRTRANSGHSKTYKNYPLQSRSENDTKLLETALEGISDVKVPSSMEIAGPLTPGSSNSQSLIKRAKAGTDASSKEKTIPVITIDGCEQEDDDDADLQRALQLSLEDTVDNAARPLELRLDLESTDNATHLLGETADEEDDELRRAVQLSLECVSTPTTSDQDEVRWRHVPILTMSRSKTESTQKLNS